MTSSQLRCKLPYLVLEMKLLGANFESVLTIPCNDKIYRINLSNMKAETYNLEGDEVNFCDDDVEYDTLLDRIYHLFYNGLKVNLSGESKYLI